MIITTTPFVDGYIINSYKGLVFTSEVIGINFLAEAIFTSTTDFFGGRSGRYRSKLKDLYDYIYKGLEESAREKGANAVVGLRIEYNEITGKGHSMLMAVATGTAVSITADRFAVLRKIHDLHTFLSDGIISQEEYEFEKNKIESAQRNLVAEEAQNRKRYEEEQEALVAQALKEIEAKKALKVDLADYATDIANITLEEVESYNLTDLRLNELESMSEMIDGLLSKKLYIAAAKVYIEQTDLDLTDAKDYLIDALERKLRNIEEIDQ